MANHPNRPKKPHRTTQGLRDVLFDEIEELRSGEGDPTKAMAVASLAKQIINVAKVELDFHRQIAAQAKEGTPVNLGSMQLGTDRGQGRGTDAGSAQANAMEASPA